MSRLVGALLWVLVSAASPVSAHQKSVSYSKWTLVEGGAVVEARVRWLEVTSLPLLGARPDADRTDALPYLVSHLTLSGEAGPCEADPASALFLPADPGWLRVEWRVSCESEPSVLQSRLFASLTNHVHLATVFTPDPTDVVLSPSAPRASVRATPDASSAGGLVGYLRLGVEHILTGWDHIAFLLLLIVVARSFREVAILVTGFTVGHSVTLGAAALGAVVPYARAVEATIAASILLVALENAGVERMRGGLWVVCLAVVLFVASAALGGVIAFWGVALFTTCYFLWLHVQGSGGRLRWVVACLFGFVHGLGFSGVLIEQELPRRALVSALFGFNVGVELGQIAIVALLWPVLAWLRHRDLGGPVVEGTSWLGAAVGTCALIMRVFG